MLIRRTLLGDVASHLATKPEGRPAPRALGRFDARGRSPVFWAGLWILGAVAMLGALVPVLLHRGDPVTGIDLLGRVTGGSFVACGLIAWRRRPDSRAGQLMTATGFALFLAPLLTQFSSPVAQTTVYLFSDLWTVIFSALLLTFATGGRVRSRADRALIGAFVLSLLVLEIVWMLFWEHDGNLLAAFPDAGVADVLDKAQRSIFAAASLATGFVIAARWHAASGPRRRALLPGVAGIVCLLLFAALLINDLVTGTRPQLLLWLVLGSILVVPATFLTTLLRSRLARGGLADLVRGLGTMRDAELQDGLRRAIGDPALVVAHRLPGSMGYADDDGRPVLVPPVSEDRATAPVLRGGRPVAALIYDASLDDDPELVEAVCAAAGVALENQHLHAESMGRLTELRASRERIVAAGDAERRRLERNLHDGAQQRLVAIALQLRLVQDRIRADPAAAEQLVASASAEVAHSLSELRELAHGLHPAVLEQGLAPALQSLAGRATIFTSVLYETRDRLPQPVELAAYFVASEALANIGKYAHASTATVRVWRAGATASIEIADDGIGGADDTRGSGLRGLADRVEALEGTLRIISPPSAGTVVTAEFPCAS